MAPAPQLSPAPTRKSETGVAPQAELLFLKDRGLNKGLEIRCPGFEVDQIYGGRSEVTGQRRKTGKSALSKGNGHKGFVEFVNAKDTAEELKKGGFFQVYRASDPRKPLGDPLIEKGSVFFPLKSGQYSINLTNARGERRREPTVTFRVKPISTQEAR